MANPAIHAKTIAEAPAVIVGKSGLVYNWKQLNQAAVAYSNLIADQKVSPGDSVAWCIENRFEFIALAWAAQYSGLRYTPISTKLQPSEIDYILTNCTADLLLVSSITQDKLPEFRDRKKVPLILNIDDLPDDFLSQEQDPRFERKEGIPMLYSSGTTGKPKGIKIPFPDLPIEKLPMRDLLMGQLYGIDNEAVYLSTAPLYHAAPLDFALTTGRLGAACVIMDRFDAEHALKLIEEHGVTHSQWVPTMFFRLLQLDDSIRNHYDLSSHRVAVHGAASCPIPVKEKMMNWWGPIIHEYYAGTEGVGTCLIGPEEWLTHKGSVGRSIGCQILIVDNEGKPLPRGEIGNIWFDNCREFEYYNDSAKTSESRTESGHGTFGDVGYLDDEGYLYLTDRKSFTIVSGGINIYPQETENVLVTHPAVADAAVFGIPSEEWGEEVKGAVELMPGCQAGPDLEEELIHFCRDRLAHLKCPRSIDFEQELPRQPNGKLYKKVLQNQYRTEA